MPSVSITKINDVLIVNFPKNLSDKLVDSLQNTILKEIKNNNAKGVILDVKIVEFIDSYLGRAIIDIFEAIKLFDVAAILVGVQPFVAITVIELGVNMKAIQTASTVERGLELIKMESGYDS